MQAALRLAAAGDGTTWPNPSVGAVVFRGEKILGRGRTRPVGGDHAEIVALASARRRVGDRGLRGASLAVTLEPCAVQGRTGPCVEALVEAGLRRVFIGCRDSNPKVNGRGVRQLRRSGIEVEMLSNRACRLQHRGFLSVQERGRPFVSLKLAATLDGRIATAQGESRWITGPKARRFVHDLRARSDAILIGADTVLADDPRLDARRPGKPRLRPVRVLVDSRLRVPLEARLYRGRDVDRTWVLCSRQARGRKARLDRGARILETPAREGHVDLRRALARLAREGLTEVLVEGGGELAAALLRRELVDELHWFTAPSLIGGDGRPSLGALGLRALSSATFLRDLRTRQLDSDVLFSGSIGDFP